MLCGTPCILFILRSRGSTGKGKESEYENLESEPGDSDHESRDPLLDLLEQGSKVLQVDLEPGRTELNLSRDSEQREIDEFEEEERRLLAEESKVYNIPMAKLFKKVRPNLVWNNLIF